MKKYVFVLVSLLGVLFFNSCGGTLGEKEVVCSHCHGTGSCSSCGGAGKYGSTTCSTCYGSGQAFRECVVCHGVRLQCIICDGTGRNSLGRCTYCNGTGLKDCIACGNTGSVKSTCNTCRGSGMTGTSCSSCNGTGKCASCGGNGTSYGGSGSSTGGGSTTGGGGSASSHEGDSRYCKYVTSVNGYTVLGNQYERKTVYIYRTQPGGIERASFAATTDDDYILKSATETIYNGSDPWGLGCNRYMQPIGIKTYFRR